MDSVSELEEFQMNLKAFIEEKRGRKYSLKWNKLENLGQTDSLRRNCGSLLDVRMTLIKSRTHLIEEGAVQLPRFLLLASSQIDTPHCQLSLCELARLLRCTLWSALLNSKSRI